MADDFTDVWVSCDTPPTWGVSCGVVKIGKGYQTPQQGEWDISATPTAKLGDVAPSVNLTARETEGSTTPTTSTPVTATVGRREGPFIAPNPTQLTTISNGPCQVDVKSPKYTATVMCGSTLAFPITFATPRSPYNLGGVTFSPQQRYAVIVSSDPSAGTPDVSFSLIDLQNFSVIVVRTIDVPPNSSSNVPAAPIQLLFSPDDSVVAVFGLNLASTKPQKMEVYDLATGMAQPLIPNTTTAYFSGAVPTPQVVTNGSQQSVTVTLTQPTVFTIPTIH